MSKAKKKRNKKYGGPPVAAPQVHHYVAEDEQHVQNRQRLKRRAIWLGLPALLVILLWRLLA